MLSLFRLSINEMKTLQNNEYNVESVTLQNESILSASDNEEQDTLEAYMKMNERLLQDSNAK
jgi:hypothetical protein